MVWIYVAVGGALGTLARYGLSGWVQDVTGSPYPWGTMTVNVVGCLILGFAVVWLETSVTSPEVRQLTTIGVLGAFTTFSTFSYEAVALIRDGQWWAAGGYVGGSLLAGLLGVVLGFALATYLLLPKG